MKATKRIIQLAATCGIDARNLTVAEVKTSHERYLVNVKFVDQHDMALSLELKAHEAAVKRSIERMAEEITAVAISPGK